MEIGGIQKCSLIDFPGLISIVVFTQGCNFNCHYCHNQILIPVDKGIIYEQEVFELIEQHQNMLDAVTISGGEPTLQTDLVSFIKKLKKYELKVKVDTNGSKPEVLKKILPLIDYIAMDYKAGIKNYNTIAQSNEQDIANKIKKSMQLILESGVDYQFRTTGDFDKEQVKKEMKKYNHKFQEIKNAVY